MCSVYSLVEGYSASLVPPFAYNNQCSSVVLTSYVPVFILGFSIQLLLPFVAILLLTYVPFGSIPAFVRQGVHGVVAPEYWLQLGDSARNNEAILQSNPSVMLKICTIYCNDVFNNWLLLLTFGLCSPVLAVAITCAVVLKMSLWVLLIGRFSRCMLHCSSECKVESAADEDKEDYVHFALRALAAVHIPLGQILAGSFW